MKFLSQLLPAYLIYGYATTRAKIKCLSLLLIICTFFATNVFSDTKDPEEQYNLGMMYDTGYGVPEDNKEAVKWYQLAAEEGDADAQFNLGVSYADGEGVPKDNVIAYAWLSLARANGLDVSQSIGIIEKEISPEDKVESQKLSRQLMKDYPGVY